jgi:FMN phosphatase YigB (HAD superfamily)
MKLALCFDFDDTVVPTHHRYLEAIDRFCRMASTLSRKSIAECRAALDARTAHSRRLGAHDWQWSMRTALEELGVFDDPYAAHEIRDIAAWLAATPPLFFGVERKLGFLRDAEIPFGILSVGGETQWRRINEVTVYDEMRWDCQRMDELARIMRVVPAKTVAAHRDFRRDMMHDDCAVSAFIGDSVMNDLRPAAEAGHDFVIRVAGNIQYPPVEGDEGEWPTAQTFCQAVDMAVAMAAEKQKGMR